MSVRIARILLCCLGFVPGFTTLHAQSMGDPQEIRIGLGIPMAKIIGSQSDAFSMGVGGEFTLDIQRSRSSCYFINFDYLHFGGQPVAYGYVGDILQTPSVNDIGFTIGNSYYIFDRGAKINPLFSIEYGLHYATENVSTQDTTAHTSDSYSNHILFQTLCFGGGVEYQYSKDISIIAKLRFAVNSPFSATANQSFIFSQSELNYLQGQFVLSAQYRLSR